VRMLGLILFLPAVAAAQSVAIGSYGPVNGPNGIAAGPDRALWFAETGGNQIGKITTAGVITQYTVPSGASLPWQITKGPDGAMWFTELGQAIYGNNIGRITTSGVITEYPVPTAGSGPLGIAEGPDGAVWFTEYYGNKIGRITTTGTITEYPVPTANSGLQGIAAGPDKALWFTEGSANKIGRVTVAGKITEFRIPTANSDPYGITTGPDGALWFTESSFVNQIGRITTAGYITEYPVTGSEPFWITQGPDGALWFTEYLSGSLGRITTAGAMTEYAIPIADSTPTGIATGPDGQIWFTSYLEGKIGQAVIETASLTVSPDTGTYGTPLTFTGSGFGAGETVEIYQSGIGSPVLAHAAADGTGSFTVTAFGPQSQNGQRLFLGEGRESRKVGAASYTMTASLVAYPDSGAAGGSSVARGYGYAPYQTVYVYWDNPATLLGSAAADVNGTFDGDAALTFVVPSGAVAGINVLSGFAQSPSITGNGFFDVQ
jgi:virginiamycin B lyase